MSASPLKGRESPPKPAPALPASGQFPSRHPFQKTTISGDGGWRRIISAITAVAMAIPLVIALVEFPTASRPVRIWSSSPEKTKLPPMLAAALLAS